MQNLINFGYWFSLRPEALSPIAQKLFIGFIILLALICLLTAIFKNHGGIYRGFLKKIYSFSFANAVIGLFILFFNYELIPFLSARFWLGLWLIMMIVWLIFILKYLRKIPATKKRVAAEKEFNKYLPK